MYFILSKLRFKIAFSLLLISTNFIAQQDLPKEDIFALLKTTTSDTIKIDSYNELCWPIYSFAKLDSAVFYGKKAIELSEKIKDTKRLSIAHRRLGIAYINSNDFDKSIYHQQQSYDLAKSVSFKKGMANALNNLGVIYGNIENYNIAIDYYLQALKLREELHDSINLGASYHNIGLVYVSSSNFIKGKEYHYKALYYGQLFKNEATEAYAYDGLAAVFMSLHQKDSALVCYLSSLAINLKNNTVLNIIKSYNHLGHFYNQSKDFKRSSEYTYLALSLLKKYDSPIDLGNSYMRLSDNFFNLNKIDSSKFYALKAYHIWMSEQEYNNISEVTYNLAKIYEAEKNYAKAFEFLSINKTYNDSLIFKRNAKDIIQKQMQYEFNKKTVADSIQFAQKEKLTNAILVANKAKLNQAKTIRYSLIVGIVLILIFLGFVYSRFKISKKQNKIITQQHIEVTTQKQLVEEKQREIVDSINYARRLQGAILSNEATINQHLNHFVYYKPKDIVAGDFYFFEDYNDHLFIAACDCTGHGVPGAMVSIVCSNALTKAIKEFKLTDPAQIFDKTRELVIENFKGSDNDIKDGMDAAMIVYNKTTKTITWCGANNPLWLIDNGMLIEHKGDKQPIALYDYAKPFTSMVIEATPQTSYYLITDGYADQFGGNSGKKFKYKELKELIISNATVDMQSQKKSLSEVFSNWKSDFEQVDDVTVFGFNFKLN